MTAGLGLNLKSPYQNNSSAMSRQKQTGLERGALRDPISRQPKQNNMASVLRLVKAIFSLLAFLKST